MSGTYNPDPGVVPQAPWNVTFLSQRDVGLNIPINYVTAPGVSLAQACFADQHYEDDLFTQCLSNVLAAGFKRIIFDIYWDSPRRAWSFCPVQIPFPGQQPSPEPSPSTTSATTVNPKETSSGSAQYVPPAVTSLVTRIPRQELQSASSMTSPITPSSDRFATVTVAVVTMSNTTEVILPTPPAAEISSGVIYSIGPYTCSPTLNLDVLINILSDFLRETDDTLAAVLKYITFNLHAAASPESPEGPAQAPIADDLPAPEELIGSLFEAQVANYLYTPHQLQLDRTNLRNTWENARNETAPDPAYYTTTPDGLETTDGWPNEEYLEFEKVQRLLIGFQTIYPQMQNYNFAGDNTIMFAPNILVNTTDATLYGNGSVDRGCFFHQQDTSLSASNDSWAVYNDVLANQYLNAGLSDVDNDELLPEVNGLVSCGISPVLNVTLGGSTADQDYTPYENFVRSSVWSWAPEEPRSPNTATTGSSNDNEGSDGSRFRCAAFNASSSSPSSQAGRWYVRYCQERYHAACRADGRPHVWTISPDTGYYSQISTNCPPNYHFAVPRTALENRYLLQACWDAGIGGPGGRFSSSNSGSDSTADSSFPGTVWLDFNSLQIADCWVVGVNSTCPYPPPSNSDRDIVVPTVAAIVVLVLALSTLLVKCGANRRKERKRTRTLHGWDYEGVPS